jgi:hypothetical protein
MLARMGMSVKCFMWQEKNAAPGVSKMHVVMIFRFLAH